MKKHRTILLITTAVGLRCLADRTAVRRRAISRHFLAVAGSLVHCQWRGLPSSFCLDYQFNYVYQALMCNACKPMPDTQLQILQSKLSYLSFQSPA